MKLVARNIFFSVVGFSWSIVLALAVTPFIVRGLGETAYGIWALVGNLVGYLAVFNSLQTAGTKYLSEYLAVDDRASIQKLIGTSLVFNLTIGFLGGAAIIFFAQSLAIDIFKIPAELQTQSIIAFRLAGLGFGLGTVGWWGTAIFVGVQRFNWLAGVSIATTSVSALGSLVAIWLHGGVVGVVAANVSGALFSVILYSWSVHHLLPEVGSLFIFDWVMFKKIFSYGFFSTLQVVFGILMSQLDRTLLGIWIGVAAVTTYSIPLSIAVRIHQLCAKALEVVLPLSSGLVAESRTEQSKRLFLRAQNLNVVLVVMFSVPLLVLASEILKIWISPSFAIEAETVFRLLVIAFALLALNVVTAGIVGGFGHPEINTAFVAVLGLGNLLGYFLFIPPFGVNGAGIASVFGSFISVPIFLWYVNYRFLRVPLIEIFVEVIMRQMFIGVVVAGCLFLVRPFITSLPILLLVLIGSCLLFLMMSILMGVWKTQELELLRESWLRVFAK